MSLERQPRPRSGEYRAVREPSPEECEALVGKCRAALLDARDRFDEYSAQVAAAKQRLARAAAVLDSRRRRAG